MSVIYYSTSGRNTQQQFENVSLNDLLMRSDVVSIHAPLNDSTRNLINKSNLTHCKKNSIIMNMGRGGIVNEDDLADALLQNKIHHAVLDVFEHEPLSKNSPLLDPNIASKVVLTPHIAWASVQARQKLWALTISNIKTFIDE